MVLIAKKVRSNHNLSLGILHKGGWWIPVLF